MVPVIDAVSCFRQTERLASAQETLDLGESFRVCFLEFDPFWAIWVIFVGFVELSSLN